MWPVLRVLVPPSLFAEVLERAKAEEMPVSKWCRRAIQQAIKQPAVPGFTLSLVVQQVLNPTERITYDDLYKRVAEAMGGAWVEGDTDLKVDALVESGELKDWGDGSVSRA